MNQALLHKYFTGVTSQEEEERILDWVEASEENRQWYLKERMLYDAALFTDSEQTVSKKTFHLRPILQWTARVAAVIIVAVSGFFLFQDYQYTKVAQLQQVTVPPGQRAQITLADGTKVWLNAQSTLTYAPGFGKGSRDVTLDGEAYFEVAKDEKVPFYVHTEYNKIKVVGTSFNVCAYNGANEFGTTLVEGIVDIYEASGNRKLVRLTKDQYFSAKNGEYKKGVLPSYEYLRWREGLYCFDDAPFKEVLARLEKYYNVKITVNNPVVYNYRCTGKFRDQDGIEHILKTVRKDHPFTYRINAERDSIVIN